MIVELCAGTAAVSLWALARCAPITGYMGSKRRWALAIAEALGPADEVLLVDAGPWGEVWAILRHASHRVDVAAILHGWQGQDPSALWARLVEVPPSADPAQRVAQYLWLQARSAGQIPVWWDGTRWTAPTGSRTEAAHARGGRAQCQPGPAAETHGSRHLGTANPRRRRSTGLLHPRTLALRVESLEAIDWGRVAVVHGDVRSVEPIPGSVVYVDPPYQGCPRYAELLPRADVLALATRHAEVARVAVSEAEPLPLEGWTARHIAQREWVTASWPISLGEQLSLALKAS